MERPKHTHFLPETYQKKALVIRKEIGYKQGESLCFGNLGSVYRSLGEYGKAETYLKNALVIRKEIGDKQGEAVCYGSLGNVFESLVNMERPKHTRKTHL